MPKYHVHTYFTHHRSHVIEAEDEDEAEAIAGDQAFKQIRNAAAEEIEVQVVGEREDYE